jgi:hypothetical protein
MDLDSPVLSTICVDLRIFVTAPALLFAIAILDASIVAG